MKGLKEKYILKSDEKRIFNSGIFKLNNEYIICYRSSEDKIHLTFLDSYFKFFTEEYSEIPGLTDPKIILSKDGYKLIGSWPYDGDEYMEISDFSVNDHKFVYLENKKRLKTIVNYPNYTSRREKSWSPFYAEDKLYFIYKKNPHEILVYDESLESVVFLPECSFDNSKLLMYGEEIRGNGTACNFTSNLMITTFHVKMPTHYLIGYYTFESKYPFKPYSYCKNILVDSRESGLGIKRGPLIGDGCTCAFPGGVVDEGDSILISFGVNDMENHFLKYDKNWLIDNSIVF